MKLLIDEFQRVPSILLEIKRVVDEKNLKGEETGGMFWLTGSQKFLMMRDISESLAGRVAVFDMAGLSAAEIEGDPYSAFSPEIADLKERIEGRKKKNVHEVYEVIFRRSMPKIIASDVSRDRYYADFINTYLERDVKDLAQVGKINELYDFLAYLATRTAQELHYDEIVKSIGVSAPTVNNRVTILVRSGVIALVRPFIPSVSKRLVKAPKVCLRNINATFLRFAGRKAGDRATRITAFAQSQ